MNAPLPESFSLLGDLTRGGVDFAVVGGVAVSLSGFIRATDDVEILISEEPENVPSTSQIGALHRRFRSAIPWI
jgi:hypothetical protein